MVLVSATAVALVVSGLFLLGSAARFRGDWDKPAATPFSLLLAVHGIAAGGWGIAALDGAPDPSTTFLLLPVAAAASSAGPGSRSRTRTRARP